MPHVRRPMRGPVRMVPHAVRFDAQGDRRDRLHRADERRKARAALEYGAVGVGSTVCASTAAREGRSPAGRSIRGEAPSETHR